MTDSFRDRQRAFREQEILRASRSVLDELGCRSFTMGAVAARLGVSKGTLYRHFPSREDLLRRVVRGGWEVLAEEARRVCDEASEDRRVPAVAAFAVRRLLGLDGSPPCCLEEVECPYLEPGSPEVLFRPAGTTGPDGFGLGGASRALAASLRARWRAQGRAPTEEDARALLALLLGRG